MSWYINELSAMEEMGGGGGETHEREAPPVITAQEDHSRKVASLRPA